MQRGINSVGSWIGEKADNLKKLNDVMAENEDLKRQVDDLTTELNTIKLEQYELDNLRELLKLDQKYPSYDKVAANVMKKNSEKNADGKETYSLTPVGEYYISFDGDEVLMKDLKSGKYKKLENRYQDYSAKGQTAQSTTK